MPAPDPPFRYRAEILVELLAHGVQPSATTTPQLLRDHVRDLYLGEIRALRAALLGRAFPRSEYADRVVALRRRYVLLSIPLERWIERAPGEAPGAEST